MWSPNWVRFVERNVGAWMHIEHILGLYVFAACNRSGPTNMHNTAMVINSEHKIRFAQDLALYNLTLSEEIEGFDGAAHIEAWNSDAEWQGARAVCEALTASRTTGASRSSPRTVVFEPLIGELFRSNLVHAVGRRPRRLRHADRHGRRASTTTPSATCAGRSPASPRSPRTGSSPTTTSSSCRAG